MDDLNAVLREIQMLRKELNERSAIIIILVLCLIAAAVGRAL
jgi:hypothetical protein